MACRSCCYVISKETTILLRGGGSARFNRRVFCRNFGQIFVIHRWPFSFNREGCDKKYPLIYRGRGYGGGCPISKTSFNNQIADVKGTKWSTIKSWKGGGLIKNCRDRLFISSMGQGQEGFQTFDSWSESRKFDSWPAAVQRTMCECRIHLACKTPLAAQWRGYSEAGQNLVSGLVQRHMYVPSLCSCAYSITIKLYYFYFKILGKIHISLNVA